MPFAKKQFKLSWLSSVVFTLSYGFLLSFFALIFGEKMGFFIEGIPGGLFGSSFVLGMLLGFFLEKAWKKMTGLNKDLVTVLVVFLFTALTSILGLTIGALLGGNGIVYFEFAGLQGYESGGLILGCLSAFLGLWIASRALFVTTKKSSWILLSSGLLLLALLLISDLSQSPNLASVSVLALPALATVLHFGFKF